MGHRPLGTFLEASVLPRAAMAVARPALAEAAAGGSPGTEPCGRARSLATPSLRHPAGGRLGCGGGGVCSPPAPSPAIPRPRSCSPSAPSLPRLLPRHRDFHSSQSPAADTGLNQVEHQFQMSEFTFKTHNFWNTMAGQQRHRVLAAPSRAGPRAGRSPALLETCTHVGNFVLSLHRLP